VDTALYFPYIRVPESAWFTQVLLYWDDCASIVPENVQADDTEIGPYMSALIRAGLMKQMSPLEAISEGDVPFFELLETYVPPAESEPLRWTRMNFEKVNSNIFEALQSRGLARAIPGDYSWGAVEDGTANLYMAYLVGSVCRQNPGFYPVTDTKQALAALGPTTGSMATRLQELRYAAVTQALPVPSRPIPPMELASFKEEHGEQLRRLRLFLNGQLADLAEIDDTDILEAKIGWVLQSIRDDVARLHEQMTRRSWPRIVMVGVGGILASALSLALIIHADWLPAWVAR
jgi:hypothetical protein